MTEVNADKIAEIIRAVDGNHTLGAGALADKIAEYVESTREISDLEIVQKALRKKVSVLTMWGDNGWHIDSETDCLIGQEGMGNLLAWAKQQLGE